jgi:hypothetical protein
MSTLAATNLKHESSASNNIVLDSSGNVGIGTSSPAGKLDILTGTYRGYFDDAAGSLFRLNGVNAANSAYGPMSLNGSVLTFQTSASERVRIDSSGNVGIGTSSPGAKLEVVGNIKIGGYNIIGGANNSSVGMFAGTAFNTGGASIVTRGISNGYNDGGIEFYTGSGATGSERMRINSSGNVGIGTSSPGAKLAVQNDRAATALSQVWSVYNGASFENDVTLAYTGSVTNFGNFQSNPLAFLTNNTERMRINSSGNVGIGTSSPSTYGLSVYKSSGAAGVEILSGANIGEFAISGTDLYVTNKANGPTQFWTNGAERARINSSGVLLVGTTTGLSGHTFQNGAGASTYRPTTTSGFGIHHFYSDVSGAGSLKAYVQADGTYLNASDEKLKTNIVKARSYLNDLMKIEIVNYTWKGSEDNDKRLGVVAQQVESVFPSLVKEVIGNPVTGETQKMLPQEVFIPMLITAIQELKADFDAYKAAHP